MLIDLGDGIQISISTTTQVLFPTLSYSVEKTDIRRHFSVKVKKLVREEFQKVRPALETKIKNIKKGMEIE